MFPKLICKPEEIMDPKERIEQLTALLNEAGHQYYVLDDPKMPDFEYDRLLRELENLEQAHPEWAREDSPTRRVGGEALSQFEKVSHPVPLMSLQDVFSKEELNSFLDKILQNYPDTTFSVEPKIDGLSVLGAYLRFHIQLRKAINNILFPVGEAELVHSNHTVLKIQFFKFRALIECIVHQPNIAVIHPLFSPGVGNLESTLQGYSVYLKSNLIIISDNGKLVTACQIASGIDHRLIGLFA